MAETVTSRGWQVGKSPLDCHKHMLENRIACDVKFMFNTPGGSTETILAHKYMLMCRSPVFEAMFCGDFTETSDPITITDIEPQVFKEILKYMYYDEFELAGDTILHVLFAAKKYILEDMVDRCLKFLEENMSVDNVCTIFNQCLMYDDKELAQKCKEFAIANAAKVVQSADFLQLSHDALYELLSCDEFGISSEADLYRACVRWAKHHAIGRVGKADLNIRDVLGKCFYQIRFISMTTDELMDISEDEPFLVSDEQLYFQYLVFKGKAPAQNKANMSMFNLQHRIFTYSNDITVANRFLETLGGHWPDVWVSGCDEISFKTDKTVYLTGVTLYGGFHKGKENQGKVTLTVRQNQSVLVTTDTTMVSDGTPEPIPVLLSKRVLINPDVLYTIITECKVIHGFYGEGGQTSVAAGDVIITFHSDNNGRTDVNRGQIPQPIIRTKNPLDSELFRLQTYKTCQ